MITFHSQQSTWNLYIFAASSAAGASFCAGAAAPGLI